MTSPTQLSLKKLRSEGYIVAIVEKYNIFSHRRIDLFSFGDLLAVKEDMPGSLIIQTTTASNMSAHVHKVLEEEEIFKNLKTWLSAGNRFIIHGWSKKGPRGKRKVWEVNTRDFTWEEVEFKDECNKQNNSLDSQKEVEVEGGTNGRNEEMVSKQKCMDGYCDGLVWGLRTG